MTPTGCDHVWEDVTAPTDPDGWRLFRCVGCPAERVTANLQFGPGDLDFIDVLSTADGAVMVAATASFGWIVDQPGAEPGETWVYIP